MELKVKKISEFKGKIKYLFTDIDDTLTDEGVLSDTSYSALWNLFRRGVHVIPVTGRPAGWCEMIARQWPVRAVIGENGAFVFYKRKDKIERTFFSSNLKAQNSSSPSQEGQKYLLKKSESLFEKFPGTRFASDQFCRWVDVAIDFSEEVHPPLTLEVAQKIKAEFESWGAQAKVSSIHVNAWMGDHDKLSMTLKYLKEVEKVSKPDKIQSLCGFVGDSPNDEPMWQFFKNSFSVGPIQKYKKLIKHFPQYSVLDPGGVGFKKIAQRIIANQNLV